MMLSQFFHTALRHHVPQVVLGGLVLAGGAAWLIGTGTPAPEPTVTAARECDKTTGQNDQKTNLLKCPAPR